MKAIYIKWWKLNHLYYENYVVKEKPENNSEIIIKKIKVLFQSNVYISQWDFKYNSAKIST